MKAIEMTQVEQIQIVSIIKYRNMRIEAGMKLFHKSDPNDSKVIALYEKELTRNLQLIELFYKDSH